MAEKGKKKEDYTFLIVDPFTKKRTEMIALLRKLGYKQFEQAPDGAAGYSILKRRPVDIIISGWNMPIMNGLALLKVVSSDEDLYNTTFFVMIQQITREVVVEAGKLGVAGILVEPISITQIEKKLDDALGLEEENDKSGAITKLFKKAKALVSEKRMDEALVVLEEIVSSHESAEIYYNIGYIKTSQGKFNEAILAFRKAVMINNTHAKAYKKMGDVYLKMGDKDEAEKYFEKAGEIFLERNMDKEAEMAFKEVLKISPETINIYNSLGIIYRRQHDYKKAITQYLKALEVDPKDENIMFNLGRALLEDKKIKDAKKMFERAVKVNPNFKEAKRMIKAIEVGF